MIKLLIGGSPCTHWSIAQKNNRETKPEGEGWELFLNYLIAREKFKPDFFLYENNKSAAQAIKDEIANRLGVGTDPNARFTYINSALVSAQNRQRFYVTNFGDIEQPDDRGILLKDILEDSITDKDNAYCLKQKAGNARDYFKKHHTNVKFEPVNMTQSGKSQTIKSQYQNTSLVNICCYKSTYGSTGVAEPVCMRYERSEEAKILRKQYEKGEIHHGFHELSELHPRAEGKTNTLSTVLKDNPICVPVGVGYRNRREEDGKLYRRFETSGISKANALTTVRTDSMVAKPIRIGTIESNVKNKSHDSKQYRVYSPDGKSTTLCGHGGGVGAKTGLYAVPVEFTDGIPVKAVSPTDGKTYDVYEVKNSLITIKDKQYPIKLPDGYYIIRKLTVIECCRLQTLPDDYCKAVSQTQAYKGLGNGWTAEVIIHLLNHALKDIPKDEQIVVLSMYDGIGTGRYCLDKMGFTNVGYYAYEIDKYAKTIANDNYPDIIQCGDAFDVRKDNWNIENIHI